MRKIRCRRTQHLSKELGGISLTKKIVRADLLQKSLQKK